MKIAVLAGGYSPERDVSLSSGSLIADSLRRSGHRVALVDVYLGREWDGSEEIFTTEFGGRAQIGQKEPDLKKLKEESGNGDALIGKNVIEICRAADLAFIAMHGGMGENGMLQAVLESFGIRYTGSRFIGCLLAMDKGLTKRLLVGEGITTAEGVLLNKKEGAKQTVLEQIGIPCVVKPCSCGSSVGVSIVESEEELDRALDLGFAWEDHLLVEKKIPGREFSVGIVDGEVMPPIEIIPKSGFYDYKNKYQSGLTTEICPADLTEEEVDAISEATRAVHKALRLGFYARIDFILSSEDHRFYCLEANALPGMTPNSLLPQEAAVRGMDYDELCRRIAEGAR